MFERDERKSLRPESGLEFFAIFENVFARVPFSEAEVEDPLTVELGDAAGTGAKAVNEPGEFLEDVELDNFEVTGRAERPRFGDSCGSGGTREGLAGFAARR